MKKGFPAKPKTTFSRTRSSLGREGGDPTLNTVDSLREGDTSMSVNEISKVGNENKESTSLIEEALPQYLVEAFGDVYREDGLVVLGRGMGMIMLLSAYVRLCLEPMTLEGNNDGKERGETSQCLPRRRPLYFVVGLKDKERSSVLATLQSWNTPVDLLPLQVTNENGQSKDRAELYCKGGVFLITSRILIVDLLTQVARPGRIDGILVANAERVTEVSTDAFIVRIYRTQRYLHYDNFDGVADRSRGTVVAFSENPSALLTGFAKTTKILQALFVRKLYLYPRFHDSVRRDLEGSGKEHDPPHVEQLSLPLTPRMAEIQNALAAAVRACLRELKKSSPWVSLGASGGGGTDEDGVSGGGLTLEDCLTEKFDTTVSRQLEHDWHRLSPASKQLVHDLRTLRGLFVYLLDYDCIQFWKLLQNLKTIFVSNSVNPSMWMLTPAADLLYGVAKERVYTITYDDDKTSKKKKSNTTSRMGRLIPTLEENPKWKVLRDVLEECRQKETQSNNTEGEHIIAGGSQILIMVKDRRTASTLQSYLSQGRTNFMSLRWLKYLEHFNTRSRAVAKTKGGTSEISEESRLLLEEENRVRHFLFHPDHGNFHKQQRERRSNNVDRKDERQPQHKNSKQTEPRNRHKDAYDRKHSDRRKRRRVDVERFRGDTFGMEEIDLTQRAALDDAIADTQRDMMDDSDEKDEDDGRCGSDKPKYTDNKNNGGSMKKFDDAIDVHVLSSTSSSFGEEDQETDDIKVRIMSSSKITIQTYNSMEGESAQLFLQDMHPSTVVLYDVEPFFVRGLEIYAATQCSTATRRRLLVYFLMCSESVEEKNFYASLEQEQTSFEKLIQHKKTMALPIDYMMGSSGMLTQEMRQAGPAAVSSYDHGRKPLSVDTRTKKNKNKNEGPRCLAVDVREFRSALPSVLHGAGLRLAPVTLSVGDYVLSPAHAIERKSVSDLYGSFASGRLYTQAEALCKHYAVACLMIEFDLSKTFGLHTSGSNGEIRPDSIISKMCLLVMHFPALRILWCRGPHETTKLFVALKRDHEEVDVDRAVEIGSNEAVDQGGDPTSSSVTDEVNETARDVLSRLPGMHAGNIRKVMSRCTNLKEFVEMPREELKQLLGPITGQKLYSFLHKKIDT